MSRHDPDLAARPASAVVRASGATGDDVAGTPALIDGTAGGRSRRTARAPPPARRRRAGSSGCPRLAAPEAAPRPPPGPPRRRLTPEERHRSATPDQLTSSSGTTVIVCSRPERSTVNSTCRPMRSATIRRCRSRVLDRDVRPPRRSDPPGAGRPVRRGSPPRPRRPRRRATADSGANRGGSGRAPPTIREGAAHPPLPHQLRDDAPGGVVDRDGEPEAHPRDRCVDADHAAKPVGERPAGVARVQRSVGLDHVLDQANGASARESEARGPAPTRRRRSPSRGSRAGCRSPRRAGRRAARRRRRARPSPGCPPSARSTARSDSGSVPITSAANERPSGNARLRLAVHPFDDVCGGEQVSVRGDDDSAAAALGTRPGGSAVPTRRLATESRRRSATDVTVRE